MRSRQQEREIEKKKGHHEKTRSDIIRPMVEVSDKSKVSVFYWTFFTEWNQYGITKINFNFQNNFIPNNWKKERRGRDEEGLENIEKSSQRSI